MPPAKELEETPVTFGTGEKIITAVVAMIVFVSGVVVYGVTARSDINTNAKDITEIKTHVTKQDDTIAEMQRKLDVAIMLLQRIDRKVGQP
jgi:cell division protein FtsL